MRSSVISDLRWWFDLFDSPQPPRSLNPRPATRDYGIWVDASTGTGIGILWNGLWGAWDTREGWRDHVGHDIGWLETIAVELAICVTCLFGISTADVLIHSDNEGVIGSFRKGRCSNLASNMSIRRSEVILRSSDITITLIYVNTKDNLADPISRAAAEFHRLSTIEVREAAVTRPDGRVRLPRHPRKDAVITPSSYHPHVLASERVLLWTTPHGLNFQHDLEQLFPKSIVLKMFFVMIQSLDEDTCSNYGAGLLRFTQFCDNLHIPESECMPASADLLSAFLSNAASTISSSTANSWMAGLHYWHTVNGAIWNGADSDLLCHLHHGLVKLVPPNSKCTRRPPVTLEALNQLKHGLDLSNSFDVAVLAIASIAFWSCCHLGELVIPGSNAFDSLKHVTRSILPITIHETNGTLWDMSHHRA
ncbi:hypothetical protein AZE42_13052, partial [Rhizopogon vesiculosus]